MTREEMAKAAENAIGRTYSPDACDRLHAAAAELRKTCATCKHDRTFDPIYAPYHECRRTGTPTPTDGSGFCHDWEAK